MPQMNCWMAMEPSSNGGYSLRREILSSMNGPVFIRTTSSLDNIGQPPSRMRQPRKSVSWCRRFDPLQTCAYDMIGMKGRGHIDNVAADPQTDFENIVGNEEFFLLFYKYDN